jgi:hypothetical protein
VRPHNHREVVVVEKVNRSTQVEEPPEAAIAPLETERDRARITPEKVYRKSRQRRKRSRNRFNLGKFSEGWRQTAVHTKNGFANNRRDWKKFKNRIELCKNERRETFFAFLGKTVDS